MESKELNNSELQTSEMNRSAYLEVTKSTGRAKIISNLGIALIFGIAMIVCVIIGVNGLAKYKKKDNLITISGYSKQQIVSDLVVWSGYYSVTAENTKDAYTDMENAKQKVISYLVSKGISESELIFSSISISENTDHYYDEHDRYKSFVTGYTLAQSVTVSSKNIDLITEVSRSATELINEGVSFQSRQPEYQYTRLEDLKVNMLAEAAKDARMRAETVAVNAGSKIGGLTYGKLSSIQITPLYTVTSDFSEWGYSSYVSNDVASIEKEVTVTVSCKFLIED